ncbi:hypothetical protein SNEBB_006569 [Seison nebaliae]|nr:hypothetical protein SNEBB_006569 [Seison nebaliae]
MDAKEVESAIKVGKFKYEIKNKDDHYIHRKPFTKPVDYNIVKQYPKIPQEEKAKKSNNENEDQVVEYVLPNHASSYRLANRKIFDVRRWFTISRAQYRYSCGISSLVSCWNYLFSYIGYGKLPPINQEEALTLLGFYPPYDSIRFGPFSGNQTLFKWFNILNEHFGVPGVAYYFFKPSNIQMSMYKTADSALEHLKSGLRSSKMSFIYHCFNHYMCPIGYEKTPNDPRYAYLCPIPSTMDIELTNWILIGDVSKRHPSIHSKRWNDIVLDLTIEPPSFLNIRRVEDGVQWSDELGYETNVNCLLAFEKVDPMVLQRIKQSDVE